MAGILFSSWVVYFNIMLNMRKTHRRFRGEESFPLESGEIERCKDRTAHCNCRTRSIELAISAETNNKILWQEYT